MVDVLMEQKQVVIEYDQAILCSFKRHHSIINVFIQIQIFLKKIFESESL